MSQCAIMSGLAIVLGLVSGLGDPVVVLVFPVGLTAG